MTYDFPTHKKGDTFPGVSFTIEIDDTPLDLSSSIIRMIVRDCNGINTLDLSNSTSGITITDAPGGIFAVDEQIIDINPGAYSYDIQITLSDGRVKTWISGKWVITQDVTYG